jgi:hypothetical protein
VGSSAALFAYGAAFFGSSAAFSVSSAILFASGAAFVGSFAPFFAPLPHCSLLVLHSSVLLLRSSHPLPHYSLLVLCFSPPLTHS